MTRPLVMEMQRRADGLRADADELMDQAIWLSGLPHHGHEPGDCCEAPDCYQAWEMYPNG